MTEKKTTEKNARIVALLSRLPSRHSIKRQGSDWQYFDERNRLVSGAGSLWELLEMEFGEVSDEPVCHVCGEPYEKMEERKKDGEVVTRIYTHKGGVTHFLPYRDVI